jgi:hypothetical protein
VDPNHQIQIIIHREDVTQNVTVFGQLAQSMSVNLDVMILCWTTLLQKSQPLNYMKHHLGATKVLIFVASRRI